MTTQIAAKRNTTRPAMKTKLKERFTTYFDDMQRCLSSGAYWSLLHVVVCLPDICAALESHDGESKGQRYIKWCDKFAKDAALTGDERWVLRCKVLHQGRAATDRPGRYTKYAFGRPATTGEVDHKRVDRATLHLDVGELGRETSESVTNWIAWLAANPSSPEAKNVQKNLPALVQVTTHVVKQRNPKVGFVIFNVAKTN